MADVGCQQVASVINQNYKVLGMPVWDFLHRLFEAGRVTSVWVATQVKGQGTQRLTFCLLAFTLAGELIYLAGVIFIC